MQNLETDELFDEKGHELREAEQQMNHGPRRPPQFEQMMAFVKSIVKKVDLVKGGRIEGGMGLSNNLYLNNGFHFPLLSNNRQKKMMGMTNEATYSLDLQYVAGELKSQLDRPTVILTAKSENTGKLEAQVIKQVNDQLTLKFMAYYPNAQVANAHLSYEADYHGADFNTSLKLSQGFQSINMCQKIGRGLSAGFEFINVPQRKLTAFSYACKYNYFNKIFHAQYHAAQSDLSFAFQQNINKATALISDLEYNTQTSESNYTLGYRQKFSTCEVTSTVNSKGKLSTILSLHNNSFGLKLCGVANLLKNTYKCGFAVNIGQRQ